jgi:hypothetical protein
MHAGIRYRGSPFFGNRNPKKQVPEIALLKTQFLKSTHSETSIPESPFLKKVTVNFQGARGLLQSRAPPFPKSFEKGSISVE